MPSDAQLLHNRLWYLVKFGECRYIWTSHDLQKSLGISIQIWSLLKLGLHQIVDFDYVYADQSIHFTKIHFVLSY